MQVNEHLECFSLRPLSVYRKGLPRNSSKVSQPALIGQSKAGFGGATLGPLRFTPPVCFPSPKLHRSFTYVSVPCLPGIVVLDTTKKVTEKS